MQSAVSGKKYRTFSTMDTTPDGIWETVFFTLGPLKLLSDGALGARTAYLNAPYSDSPQQRGMLLFESDDLKAMVKKCHEAGMQVAIHAIGDGAVDEVIDAIGEAKKKYIPD